MTCTDTGRPVGERTDGAELEDVIEQPETGAEANGSHVCRIRCELHATDRSGARSVSPSRTETSCIMRAACACNVCARAVA